MYQTLAYDPVHNLVSQGAASRVAFWEQNAFLTWQWWLLAAAVMVVAIIWWRLVDKNRLVEIICYALVGSIPAIGFDTIATQMGWYSYPISIEPFFPGAIVGISIPAMTYSIAYQKYPIWRDFSIALIIISAAFAFIGQPVLAYFGAFKLYNYSFVYSFIALVAIAGFSKWAVDQMKTARTVY